MLSLHIRSYCCREDLFSCSSSYQYDKMFKLMDDDPHKNVRDAAVIIWVCSKTSKSIEDIVKDLKYIVEEYEYNR